MGIRRRKDGAYEIRWLAGGRHGTPYKKKILKSTPEKPVTIKDARRYLRERMNEAGKKSPGEFDRRPFSELIEQYLEVHGPKLAAAWLKSTKSLIKNHIKPFFGAYRTEVIRTIDVERYRMERKVEEAADASINREVTVFLGILAWGEKMELLERSPVPRSRITPYREKPKDTYFKPEEWGKFSRAFEDKDIWNAHLRVVRTFGPVKYRPDLGTERRHGGSLKPGSEASEKFRKLLAPTMDVFRAIVLTGARVSEIIPLKWADVDLKKGEIRLTLLKQRAEKEKVLPISSALRDVLKRQPAGTGAALVFRAPEGGPWDEKRLLGVLKRACRVVRLPETMTVHDLKRTTGSWLTQVGYSQTLRERYLGHADQGVNAKHYSVTELETLVPMAEELGRIMGKAEKTAAGDPLVTLSAVSGPKRGGRKPA